MMNKSFNVKRAAVAVMLILCMLMGAFGCTPEEPKETDPLDTPQDLQSEVGSESDGESMSEPESMSESDKESETNEPTVDIGESLPKDKEYRILFIGNSYTYHNDMPSKFKAIARAGGYTVKVDTVTNGGHTLSAFASKSDEYGKIVHGRLSSGEKYDFVIMQEQSTRPVLSSSLFYTGARALYKMIVEAGATPIFYSTWGRKTGHGTLSKYGWTNESMTWKLAAAYEAIGEELGVAVAHVGLAFYDIYAGRKGVELYNEDKTHPSNAGSILAALVLYSKIFNCNPLENTYSGTLYDSALEVIRTAAFDAVFNTPEIPSKYKTSSVGVGKN